MLRASVAACIKSAGVRPLRLPLSTVNRKLSYEGKPFDKILIANRGEIACRVMRTAKRLGVKTVAIYSDADASNMHVRTADEAYRVGTNASKDSYLRMDRIIDICKKTGAQAIHPGYGFLSENAHFVDLCEKEGITFIGPSSAPMLAMGDKINSKKIAKDAGCYIIPGFDGEVATADDAVRLAKEVGYPVMIKASAGGGGKGMRVAYNDKEVREGFQLSKAEAASSFGDDRMLIERFIENPHHIEIQVVADTHGNVAAFPERECSVQRRNQKVIEESPSCMVLPETRKKMQEQAILLCKATGYRSAGTVEMLCDENQNFYFLEMNTRLQVEHPVTELVSGEDLVEHMLYVAAGHPLPDRLINGPTGPHVPFHGNAFEVRVYAEDPIRGFLPSIGPLISYKEPRTFTPAESGDGSTVRIDTGVFEGGTISMHYDPLISKLCSHAPTREHSIQTIERALDEYVIQGLGNNLTFCRDVFRNPVFRKGIYSTKFIPEQYPDGFNGVRLSTAETNQLVGIAAAIHSARTEHLPRTRNPVAVEEDGDEFDESMVDYTEDMVIVLPPTKGCGHNEIKQFAVTLSVGSELCADITPMDAQGELDLSKKSKIVLADLDWHSERPSALVTFDHAASVNPDTTAHAKESDESDHSTAAVQYLGRAKTPAGQGGFLIRYNGSDQEVVVHTPREHALSRHMLPPAVLDHSKSLICPMPGTLISLDVKEGQAVTIGQQLAVVEAMKMQNVLHSELEGVVKKVYKNAGSPLKVDEVIIEFE